jgi:outer membrane immunogenic protein
MRGFVVAAVMFGAASAAQAADLPDLPILRGGFTDGLNTAKVNWQGYYIGAQGGYGSSDENFSGSTQAMTAAVLNSTAINSTWGISQWPLDLNKVSARSSGFGGFGGYNSQWDDVVIGVEASYLHGGFGGSSTASQYRWFSPTFDSNYHGISSSATTAISISDMATMRARAGYAYGIFLPYLFGGVALGDADITRSVQVIDKFSPVVGDLGSPCSTTGGLPQCAVLSTAQGQHGHLIYGYSGGLGVDVNLVSGLFLRAEWEYIRFTSVFDVSVNTGRIGIGYKF